MEDLDMLFELPNAKRVRREELYDSDRPSSPEVDGLEAELLRAQLNARLSGVLSFRVPTPSPPPPPPPPAPTANETQHSKRQQQQQQQQQQEEEEEEEEEGEEGEDNDDDDASSSSSFPSSPLDSNPQPPPQPPQRRDSSLEIFSFRLFSSAPPQKVVLPADDDPAAGYTGPPIKPRPLSYYIRGELTPEQKAQIQHAAVSGRDVLTAARQRAWGLELPWRVTTIRVAVGGTPGKAGTTSTSRGAAQTIAAVEEGEGDGQEKKKKKKCRPGKKTRIALRKRDQKRRVEEAKKLSKEEYLREKKKRLNREKKLKRRAKEKEKKRLQREKAQQQGEGTINGGSVNGGSVKDGGGSDMGSSSGEE
ncbi:uncharacterized protein CTHT_0065390 [Thermochaetoides thermophila DSM 1495]|uniref:Uncharacterized protein n=1 Tax=Chaetomium thermophilum (strain DSM 1495 / CBS 144.50 / IMI 039719) TaxID=759272 RepID=G0SG82_CHATD|nr:hypothetical protein CTHT_0065390 [Thermochaetoides thermophila DSM 1495]EGS17221.1 hypothetical protein CTHT_0065390 [Thermochaetoides thermophila DSM 1495]